MPCSEHAGLLKTTAQHDGLSTAMLCYGLEKNGMVRAWHGHGIASVNQTRPHCLNQMGKMHSKPLAARHGRGKASARHGHGMLYVCESGFSFRSCTPIVMISHECTSLQTNNARDLGHVTHNIIAHHSFSLPVAKGHFIITVQVNTVTVFEAHLITFYAPINLDRPFRENC
jgi:hypothetical protein